MMTPTFYTRSGDGYSMRLFHHHDVDRAARAARLAGDQRYEVVLHTCYGDQVIAGVWARNETCARIAAFEFLAGTLLSTLTRFSVRTINA